jgi:hypothetical protein
LSAIDSGGSNFYWIGLTDLFHEGSYTWAKNCTINESFLAWSAGSLFLITVVGKTSSIA